MSFPLVLKPSFRFIDLFAGIGGMRLGFQNIGGQCVFTSEWDKYSQKTYAQNFGDTPHGDITKISTDAIPDHDILLAGFPCQPFSKSGLKHGFQDTRGTLFFEIHRILAAKRPPAFLLENVKELKGHDGGRTLKTIIDVLTGRSKGYFHDIAELPQSTQDSLNINLNYSVQFGILDSRDFGVPQKRQRIFIIGLNRDIFPSLDRDIFQNPEWSSFFNLLPLQPHVSMGTILEDNASVDPKYTISDRLLEGHERRRVENKNNKKGFGFSVVGKTSPYCRTISARYYKDGSEILIDQSDIGRNPRKLTPRECARIQGFPESFDLSVCSDVQLYKQFGNAVSVPVIEAIALKMVELMKNHGFQPSSNAA